MNFALKSPMDLLCECSDFRTVNLMLSYLAAYGIDHHSRALYKQLPLCVAKELPNLNLYIESRLIQTKKCLEITKGNLINEVNACVASYCLSNETDKIIERADIESELKL